MKRRGLSFILTFISFLLLAQETDIEGKVLDNAGEPLFGAIITLSRADAPQEGGAFAMSNEAGEWKITNMKGGLFLIEIRHLGYETTQFQFSTDSTGFLSIQLNEEPITLEEVVVKAYANAIRKSGDSTIYDVEKFTNGHEYDLKEVLTKLPGLSVSGDGDILYNGRRIDQLLVHSKDVVGNQHKLLGELFLAEDIEAVHVIENYQSNQYLKSSSSKTALDVKLKEGALHKWGGKFDLNAGYSNQARISTDVFNVGQKVSTTVFSRWNNTGSPILSLADYLSLQPSKKRAFSDLENFNKSAARDFQIPQALSANNDGLIAANLLLEPNPSHQSKVMLLYGSLNRRTRNRLNRVFYRTEGNSPLSGSESENFKTEIIRPTLYHKWLPSKKLTVEVELPFDRTTTSNQNLLEGTFNSIDTRSNNSEEKVSNEWVPFILLNYQFNSDLNLQTELEYLGNRHSRSLLLSDQQNLFNSSDSVMRISVNSRNNHATVANTLQYSWKDISTIRLKSTLSHLSMTQNSFSDQEESFDWEYLAERRLAQVEGGYTFQKPTFYIDALISGSVIQTATSDQQKKTIKTQKFQINAKKNFKAQTYLSLIALSDEKPMNLGLLNHQLEVIDNRSANGSVIGLSDVVKKREVVLNFVELNFARTSQLFLSVSANRIENNPFFETELMNNHLIHRWTSSQRHNNIAFRSTYNSPILFKRMRVRANINQRRSTVFTQDQSKLEINHNQASLSLRTQLPGYLNYHVSVTQQMNGNRNSESRFSMNKLGFKALFDSDDTHVEFNVNRRVISLNTQTLDHIWELNLSSNYDIGKFRITLEGKDLLNLNGASVSQNTFEFNYFDERNFTRFPGFVLVGFTYHL